MAAEERQADAFELCVRFGSGALFGAVLATGICLGLSDMTLREAAGWLAASGAFFGYLAMKFGNGFWDRLISWVPWI